jgi:L-alanine-DL-glutamate epimerase-like enolase superfamily enzyme
MHKTVLLGEVGRIVHHEVNEPLESPFFGHAVHRPAAIINRYTASICGHDAEQILTTSVIHEWVEDRILGADPFDVERLIGKLVRDQYQGGPTVLSAISGVEIACWDLIGKACSQPVYKLLGGQSRDGLPAYANGWYGGARTPTEYADKEFAREVARADYSSEFHYWLAVAHFQLGETSAAQRHLESARALSTSRDERDLYAAKLAWLNQHQH